MVEKENRGRVEGGSICGKKIKKVLGKAGRRHQQAQLRRAAKEEVAARKRAVGSSGAPPVLVGFVALAESQQEEAAKLMEALSLCVPDSQLVKMRPGLVQMAVPRFKQRFTMVQPDRGSLHAVLDTAKVCDSLVFLVCPHTGLDSWGETLLSCVLSQGTPSDPTFIVGAMDEIPVKKHTEVKRLLAKALASKLPVEKVISVASEAEAVTLLRTLGSQKRKEISFKDRRGHLFAERVEYSEETSCLALTGFVRGATISANRLIHLPGWGDFQVDRIEAALEPARLGKSQRGDQEMQEAGGEVVAKADGDRQELDCENVPDCMDGEQTWPTEEEMAAASAVSQPAVRKVAKVPRGMSDYQAAWIAEGEGEDDHQNDEEGNEDDDDDDDDMVDMPADHGDDDCSESEEEEEALANIDSQTEVMTEAGDEDYDAKHVNFAAEVDALEALKNARVDSMFPDEVDTPQDVAARVRFQKYRGLKSFRTSVWDPKENLPADYARIFQFENFDRTKKRVLEEKVEGAEVGAYVTIFVSGVGSHLVSTQSTSNLILTSLLPHEHRMSVLNMVVRKSALAREGPVKSKARLVFQCGWRRFAACPTFSQHTHGNKHKYERWFREGQIVMTTFAPICFPPASVLVFQELPDGRQSLLATGSLLSADPNRVVVKRTVLSGHAFHINKRVCTVRFMFFNREDVDWFKPVELRTKTGRRGHIKDGLGTHGHMKCIFDGQVTQQDAVLMNLYKRVFPKWTYDPFVADYNLRGGTVMARANQEEMEME